MKQVIEYITKNWAELPKSTFNDHEIVIFKCMADWDGGFGHHSYQGYGVDAEGKLLYCYSSGCSCYSDTSFDVTEEEALKKDLKIMEVFGVDQLEDIDPTTINYNEIQTHQSSY